MKKIIALILVLAMCFMLAACGDSAPDKQPAIDAFNKASVPLGEVCTAVEADPDAFSDELFNELAEMSEGMAAYKTLLEGEEEMTEEDIADAVEWLTYVDERVAEIRAEYGI